jgi:hypothetical protein
VSMRVAAHRYHKNITYLAAAGENGFITDTAQADLV